MVALRAELMTLKYVGNCTSVAATPAATANTPPVLIIFWLSGVWWVLVKLMSRLVFNLAAS